MTYDEFEDRMKHLDIFKPFFTEDQIIGTRSSVYDRVLAKWNERDDAPKKYKDFGINERTPINSKHVRVECNARYYHNANSYLDLYEVDGKWIIFPSSQNESLYGPNCRPVFLEDVVDITDEIDESIKTRKPVGWLTLKVNDGTERRILWWNVIPFEWR